MIDDQGGLELIQALYVNTRLQVLNLSGWLFCCIVSLSIVSHLKCYHSQRIGRSSARLVWEGYKALYLPEVDQSSL